jgi:hypothetical protein
MFARNTYVLIFLAMLLAARGQCEHVFSQARTGLDLDALVRLSPVLETPFQRNWKPDNSHHPFGAITVSANAGSQRSDYGTKDTGVSKPLTAPEPTSMLLVGSVLVGAGIARRRRKAKRWK